MSLKTIHKYLIDLRKYIFFENYLLGKFKAEDICFLNGDDRQFHSIQKV